jgi:hypothetical protein
VNQAFGLTGMLWLSMFNLSELRGPTKNSTLDGPVQIGYLVRGKIGPRNPMGFAAVVFGVFF